MARTPVAAVMRGERPRKPLDTESLGFSDALWGLVQLCWSESSTTRPNAPQLFEYFSPASPTWTHPLVYPAIAFVSSTNADMGSSRSRGALPEISRGVGTGVVVGSSLAFAVALFLFMSA